GNYYPASDIPQMARRLYERARVRLLVDVNYTPVPLQPSLSPVTGEPLDMSLCRLRSMSPIHTQYLKNMGVRATLVISVMVSGRLWGLIACHHYAPRRAQFETLAICEILAETLATRIAALESFNQGQAQLLVRRVEQRMIDAASRQGDWRAGLFDGSDAVLKAVNATGAALICDEQISTVGEVPATADLRALAARLDGRPRTSLTVSNSFGVENPAFSHLTPIASGLLAAPVSNLAGEYLLWFRPEQVRTVTWGGDPHKPVIIGDDPTTLSPRRSFAQWHQLVEGSSADWVPTDLITARMVADSVSDVLLQFRSLRVLVAEDQLSKVLSQIRDSDQPVVIAHPSGEILLGNDAFRRLLPPGPSPVRTLGDIGAFCEDGELRRRLTELVTDRRAWRGEVTLKVAGGQVASLFARADPVFSAPDRVLGYVLMFEDRAERKAADRARRRFQDAIVARRRSMPSRFGSNDEVRLRELISTLLDNAQLAALEITDGMQPSEMPDMLARIEHSVERSALLLTALIGMRRL
ncbi:MAG: GAF domain-containing protein, partial [Acetobacteraceae bacterium]|nr:GAF domain-containing protein [Acetobacteraceae bacterium]